MKQNDLATIQRWSAATAHLCAIAALVFLAGSAWQAITMTPGALASWFDVPKVMLSDGRRIAAGVGIIAPGAIIAYGLLRLRSSFRIFATGDVFSARAIRGFQIFAGAAMASVGVAALTVPALGLWLTHDSPGGAELPIRIGSGSLTLLVVSGVTWVFARILTIATDLQRRNHELSQENASFV